MRRALLIEHFGIRVGQRDARSSNVFFQMVEIAGAGNRQNYFGMLSTPANASWLGKVPNRPAIPVSADPGWPTTLRASGDQGMKPIPFVSQCRSWGR